MPVFFGGAESNRSGSRRASGRGIFSLRHGDRLPQLERFSLEPTRLVIAARGLDPRGSEPAATAAALRSLDCFVPSDQVRGSSQRSSAIEIVRGKRNFDAAAPHWLSASFAPYPPCFSLLEAFFSCSERGLRVSHPPKRYVFSDGCQNKAPRGGVRGTAK
jgi:hypothetical protein